MSPKSSGARTPRNTAYTILVLLVAAALLAGGYAWLSSAAPPRLAGPLAQVAIANLRYPGTCPVVVAQAKGYFANEGVSVTMQSYTSGKAVLDAVFHGQADLGTTGDLPVMFAVVDHQPAAIVATIATSENDLGIVGRKDRGVVTPADLKGKRIGVSMVSSGQFLLDVVLTRQKLTMSDVEAHDLKPEELSAALAKGDIDAAATWQPYLGTLRSQLGENGTTFPSAGIYDVALNLVGSRDYVANHAETIKKILRALISAARFCKDSPDAARELVAAAMKPDTVNLQALWPSYRFDIVLDQSLVLALEDETRWAIRSKLTARADAPNYLDNVYLDGLQSVAPSAVTIIH